jgi:hypothetical protein
VYKQQQEQEQQQQDAENPFLNPPFSRIKTGLWSDFYREVGQITPGGGG